MFTAFHCYTYILNILSYSVFLRTSDSLFYIIYAWFNLVFVDVSLASCEFPWVLSSRLDSLQRLSFSSLTSVPFYLHGWCTSRFLSTSSGRLSILSNFWFGWLGLSLLVRLYLSICIKNKCHTAFLATSSAFGPWCLFSTVTRLLLLPFRCSPTVAFV